MQYLWKLFLKDYEIPNVIFLTKLKTMFIDRYSDNYNKDKDTFYELTSKYLPLVSAFNNFWNTNIEIDENEHEFEIDELTTLFRHCHGTNKGNINEKLVLDLIKHYYPDIIIENDKYISNIKCKLWDKSDDIEFILNTFKQEQISNENNNVVSINKLYDYYCKLLQNNQYIVSKRYFDKYINNTLYDHLNGTTIQPSWWLTCASSC